MALPRVAFGSRAEPLWNQNHTPPEPALAAQSLKTHKESKDSKSVGRIWAWLRVQGLGFRV